MLCKFSAVKKSMFCFLTDERASTVDWFMILFCLCSLSQGSVLSVVILSYSWSSIMHAVLVGKFVHISWLHPRLFLASGWEWERRTIVATLHHAGWSSQSCIDRTDSNAGSTKETLSGVLCSQEASWGPLLLWNVPWTSRPLSWAVF